MRCRTRALGVLAVIGLGWLMAGSTRAASGECQELPADFDGDGRVDQADLGIFLACLTGPAVGYDAQALPPGCTLIPHPDLISADFDGDGDVDQQDFGVVQQSLGVVGKLPGGLLAYYRLDGTAADCSRYANDGISFGVTWDANRKVGTHSAEFDGLSDYLRVPGGQGTAVDLHSDSFSIAFWVKFHHIGTANVSGQRILRKGDTSRYEVYVSYPSGPGPVLCFAIDDGISEAEIEHSAAQSATVFSGDWVHITVSRDATNDILKYYINSSLIATVTGAATGDISSPGHDLMIGTNQNADGNWFDGSLDDVRIYNRALGAEQINAIYMVGSVQASAPNPTDGAAGLGPTIDLSWTAGFGAESHDVYFGTNEQAVIGADHAALEYKGNRPAASTTYDPGLLAVPVTYYWRIDEIDGSANTSVGSVWSFTTAAQPASLVRPGDGVQAVDPQTDLVWTAGASGGPYTHDVYLGTSQQAVADATHGSPEYKGSQAGTTYGPDLDTDTTYYWRIDEVNPSYTWKGQVWSFTTLRPIGRMLGVNYVWGINGSYGKSTSDLSLAAARDVGCNWIMINAFWFQDTLTSTVIYPHYVEYYSATPESVGHAIDRCHELGMQVILRPVVDIKTGEWKGNIVPTDAWFDSFRDFMNFWADVARGYQGQYDAADMMCLCAELDSTCTPEWASRWAEVIANVRSGFGGPLTYGGNRSNYQSVPWWNLLDYIGIEAYWGLTQEMNPTLAQLKGAWHSRADSIESWRNSHYPDKKVIFTEVGYQSRDGTNITPAGTPDDGLDLQEQADCYEALLSELETRDWWMGVFWWYWDVNPKEGVPTNTNFTPRGKPAQDVMENHYK